MGFFDFVRRKIQELNDEMQEAEMEAERWCPEQICDALARTSSIPKISGYSKELKSRARDMSTYELKYLFNYAWYARNSTACNALYPIMEEKDLCYKNEDGKIKRNY